MLAFAACSGKDPNTTDPTEAPVQTEATTTEAAEPTDPAADYMGKPFDETFDMAIVYDGHTYPVHCDAAELIAALGDDYEYGETISCTREGYEKTYEYDGLRIDTLPAGDNDIVGLFVITGPEFKTPRNITVGATRDEVIAAYGDKYFDDGYHVYTKSNDPANIGEMRIQIVFENDIAVEINVYAPDYSN